MITFSHTGDLSKTTRYFKKLHNALELRALDKYGREGVNELASHTPTESGETASSWSYDISRNGSSIKITFNNSNINNGVPIAIILQYGHGTGTGGYVQGRDYINPAIRPIFDKMADAAWEEVTKL